MHHDVYYILLHTKDGSVLHFTRLDFDYPHYNAGEWEDTSHLQSFSYSYFVLLIFWNV